MSSRHAGELAGPGGVTVAADCDPGAAKTVELPRRTQGSFSGWLLQPKSASIDVGGVNTDAL